MRGPRPLGRLLAALVLGLAFAPGLGGVASAAPAAQDGGATSDAGAQAPVEGEAEEALELASPRALFEHFLSHMKAAREEGDPRELEQAARVFERYREDRGAAAALAEDLYDVLNKIELVDLETLPDASSPAVARERWTYDRRSPADPARRVVLGFSRDAERGWHVSRADEGAVGRAADALAGVPYVADVLDSLSPLARLHYEIRDESPEVLKRRVFLIENWQWIGLAVLLFVVVVLDQVTRRVLNRVVRRLARREGSPVPAEELESFERPVGILVAALLFDAFTPVLGLPSTYGGIIRVATGFVAVVAGIWATYRLVDVLCGVLERKAARTENRFDDVLVPLLRRTLKILLTVVALFYLASQWTDDLWGIVAGLSIGSIAVGFAARDSIENLFGTFTVLLDKPFELGDWITVGEIDGTVESVGFRSTRVRTFANSLISVPNRVFISSHVDNWGRRQYRRFSTVVALPYDTPPEEVEAFCEGVRELVRRHPCTRKDYYHVYLNELGASSLQILLYVFFQVPDWAAELRERHRLIADVLRLAKELGVSFALPSQSLYLVDPSEPRGER